MDKRSYARKGLSLDCAVEIDGAEKTCHVLDLSSGGARIRMRGEIERGQTVTLKLVDLGDFEAEVRWARNGSVGLAFTGDPDDIGELLYDFMVYGIA